MGKRMKDLIELICIDIEIEIRDKKILSTLSKAFFWPTVIETISLKIYIRHVLKTIKKVTLQWHTIKPGTPEHGTMEYGTPAEQRNNAGTPERGTPAE